MKAKDLKNSILQLAIQGKLVPQDPKDEPASKLLEKIRAAKQKLVKEGKIKKDKQESFIYKGDDNNYYEKIGTEVRNITGEIPFEIPGSWAWVRLKDIVSYHMGKTPPRKEVVYWDNAIYPWVSIADMRDNDRIITTREKVNQYAFLNIFKGNISKAGTLLMSFKLTVGKVSILSIDAFHNEAIISIYPHYVEKDIQRNYLFKFLPLLTQFGKTKTAIKGNTLNSDSIDTLLIPLPPVQEQARIVACIERLEPFIEEYNLVESELSKLNENFPEQIKKSILQYAIQGKLVPQDPKDEPASVLLEKIEAEKQKLIKAGKIKKDKVESYIYKRDNRHYEKIGDKEVDITDEIPFEIPDSWAWTRLGNLVQVLSDGTHKTPQYVAKGVPFLSVQNISSGKFDFTKLKYITQEEHSKLIQRVKPTYNDILFCRIGTLGKAIKCTLDFEFSIFVSLGLIRLVNFSMNDYVILLFNSPLGDRWIQDNKVGGGTHTFKLNLVDIPRMLLPIPPLAEQDRIVAKVKKLLKLLPSND